ncbi:MULTISPECIES: sugar kinase [Streptomyces]|uniref:sugar kinase n=1 Tax=Streptomyces TaxID=1883 RepID=UPI001964B5CD|nr:MULTISPECIES: sugar kinase [Streptomyces]QRX94030.1 sugar kinase [Streptomyces noursei]UJB43747.1 sugar kinase [Streptomyces sp. A1-5]
MTRSSNVNDTPVPAAGAAPDVDVVCLGESMVTFLPTAPGPLADVPAFERAIGGAESNVACALARAGHPTRWISRVGADGFGDHLVREIAGYGVDTRAVRRDPLRPTGIYFRTAGDRATAAHEVAYYRAGSAASAMAPATIDLTAVRSGRVLHLSGITAALSADCLGLLRVLMARAPHAHGDPPAGATRPLVSFDVNYRPHLWSGTQGPRVLLDLARTADVVFVGADEAQAAWGLPDPRAVRAALPEPETLVVKLGAAGALVFRRAPGAADRDEAPTGTLVPAPTVDVVAAVGAGDAFAAGFLSAALRGLPLPTRVRHGHLWAAAALTVPGDLAAPPVRALADRLAALDDGAWGTLHLGPGWTDAMEAADQEGHAVDERSRTTDERHAPGAGGVERSEARA